MPLNKSGSKKAFSENVRTEMHHGKPQKQALAIAYDVMRRSGHKMAHGGMCEACGGECKYADGGNVDPKPSPSPYEDAGKTISKSIPSDKAKSMANAFEAKGGLIKGVHEEIHPMIGSMDKGQSKAGDEVRWAKARKESGLSPKHNNEIAKKEVHRVTEENRSINPKLKGLAHGGSVPGFDLNDQAVANWMAEGKHTGEYAEGGEAHEQGESAEHELLEHCASELMEAFEKKDKQGILDSLKAIVLSLKG